MLNEIEILKVFIVDDKLLHSGYFLDGDLYSGPMAIDKLSFLVNNSDWKGEPNLHILLKLILNHEKIKGGRIEVLGFTKPSFCLMEIDKGNLPDVVIYDWEYGSQHGAESNESLKEILALTDAFVFVYSMVRNMIPPFLNKSDYDGFASRFQLFEKGSDRESIFTSEEFILQYLISRVSKEPKIRINGKEVLFTTNGYLKEPKDILFLERIFNKEFILSNLTELIDDESMENLLNASSESVFWEENSGFLISPSSESFVNKFQPKVKLSLAEASKRFGIGKVEEALTIGIVKV